MSVRTVSFNQFDGGMVNDPRSLSENLCQTSQHFDCFTDKFRLTPYRSAESGDSSASTNEIANYTYVDGTLYGLGVSSLGVTKLFTRTNFTDATWTADAGGYSLISARTDADTMAFLYYKTTGKIYGVRAGQYVWSVIPGTSANTTERDLTAYTNVSNMIVHSKDDTLYLGYDNKIASNNNGTWATAALTLPSDMIVTMLCEYQNYLAIGCRPKTGLKSKVFLWDRNSSNTTLSESIDWSEGNLLVLEELEGYLIGVSFLGTTGSYSINGRTVFHYYNGSGGAIKFREFVGFSQSPAIQAGISNTGFKQKANSRIYFTASIPIIGTSYVGLWSIGRSSIGESFGVTLDRLILSQTSTTGMYGFIKLGDYVFLSYSNSGTFALDKTDDTATYTTTSVYETLINPLLPERYRMAAGARSAQKTLKAVAIGMQPLTSGQQVVLKYRTDGGSWVTIVTETTVGMVIRETAFDANGNVLASGREFEFRFESTGGAVITEFKYKYEELQTLL